MFDSVTVLARRRRRFGAPAAVSLVLHALVLLAIPAMTAVHVARTQRSDEVFVLLHPRRPAPTAAPQAATPAPKPASPKRKIRRRPVAPALLVPPTTTPVAITATPEPPAESLPAEPAAAPARPLPREEAARPDGIPGGIGTAGTSNAGTATLAAQSGPIEYDDALMTPPERVSGPDPDYTYLARTYEVQGMMVVKCVVTTVGVVRDCRVLQGLPYMNEAVVDALLRRRYAPARLANGKAVDVEYTFRIRLQLVR